MRKQKIATVLWVLLALVAAVPATGAQTTMFFNVKHYGAKGNGVTLDTAGINTAIAYSPFLLKRYTVWNPTMQTTTMHYLMATFVPYQVMLVRSQIQFPRQGNKEG